MTHDTFTTTAASPDDEIDLMDLLLILSEHLKILILLPVFGLLLGGGFVFWQSTKQPTYASYSSVFAETPTSQLEKPKLRAEVLIGMINTGDPFKNLAIDGAAIQANLGRSDRLVNISVTAPSAEMAQTVNQAVLDKIFEISKPSGEAAQRLQMLLKNEQQRLSEVQKLITDTPPTSQSSPESIQAYGELLELASKREFAIDKIQAQLSGLSPQDVINTPTVGAPVTSNKKGTLLLIAGFMGGGLLALMWIFMRHALSTMRKDPQQNKKWAQIKSNLSFKKPGTYASSEKLG